jgi:hypothetical protein
MNKKNLRRLAKALEDDCMRFNEKPIGLFMGTWFTVIIPEYDRTHIDKIHPHCGSIACVAGHADILFENGREALGLDGFEQLHLYYASGGIESQAWVDINREQAVYHIRKIIRGGEINWKAAVEEFNGGKRLTDDDVKEFCS